MFAHSARAADPGARLRDEIGDELTQLALEGFQAVLLRHDLPTPQHIAELQAKNRYYQWWYAILAGMDERWSQKRCLDAFSDSALEAALCLHFQLPTSAKEVNSTHPTKREWPDLILAERPNLAVQAFRGFLCPFCEKRASHISLLNELVNNEKTLTWRGELALELLERFSTAAPEALRKLLYAALSAESCRERLAELT
jgi:hypothetical protein